jgi:hypothetical protein
MAILAPKTPVIGALFVKYQNISVARPGPMATPVRKLGQYETLFDAEVKIEY